MTSKRRQKEKRQKEKTEDERLSELTTFAPLKREQMLRPEEGDAPSPKRRGMRNKTAGGAKEGLSVGHKPKKGGGHRAAPPKMKKSASKPEASSI